jgi:hypothetical protein
MCNLADSLWILGKNIQPYLSSVSGVYRPPATSDEISSQDSLSVQSPTSEGIHEPRANFSTNRRNFAKKYFGMYSSLEFGGLIVVAELPFL